MKVNLPPIKCACVCVSSAEENEKQRPSREEDEIAAAPLPLVTLACICSIAPTCVIVTPHLTRRRRVAASRAPSEPEEANL